MAAERAVRPPVAVIVPFAGGEGDAHELRTALDALDLGPEDEIVVADNSVDQVFGPHASEGRIRVVPALRERSSYAARNDGVAASSAPWLLFIDADTRPDPDLLDRFFDARWDESVGAVSGRVDPILEKDTLVGRYSVSRRGAQQERHLEHPYRPMGATANLLVSRKAYDSVGGFVEGIRSGGDADFCWRLQDAGWTLRHAPEAVVRHVMRDRLRALIRQYARYAAGRRWLLRRHPDATVLRPRAFARLLRCAVAIPALAVAGRPERAAFKAIDAVVVVTESIGYTVHNRPPPWPGAARPRGALAVIVESFPVLSQTFVASEARAIADLGRPVRIEAISRPREPNADLARGIPTSYMTDDGLADKAGALAWLAGRHPLGVARDLLDQRRWWRGEPVLPLRGLAPVARRAVRLGTPLLHAHFADGSALSAMRISRLIGIPYAVTAHAHEIFRDPANLGEKLGGAALVATGCDYNIAYLKGAVPELAAARVEKIVMAVDPDRFRRTRSTPEEGPVLAVGRLVEKKGFRHLIEAASHLPGATFQIVGEGPLRGELESLIDGLDLGDRFELLGARPPSAVKELLESAVVLACPCVIASDGDRDSMPVVIKEAMAMEVPVVASDEVGVPEVVSPPWGRLVRPADPVALAEALGEVLTMAPEERATAGRAGRRRILEGITVEDQARRLLEAMDESVGR